MAFQGDSIYWVDVEKVVPNPFQPRREFDQNKLQELADSIRMYGVLQPLTVTRNEVQQDNGTFYTEYELIAGERRLRASKLAGSAQVPVIIREGEQNEQEKLELAIIENLQREDLNAVDRALAFKQLAEVFGLSHAQVAQKVGRSREYVSNSIRLLGLPEHMLESLKRAEMMEGHARTLLMLTDRPEEQEVVYKEVLLKKLSVREVERIVRKIATDKVRKRNPGDFDEELIQFEKQFTESLGTRVQILKTDFGGKLTIDYFSNEDLEEILKKVSEAKVNVPEPTVYEQAERLTQETPLEVLSESTEAVVEDVDSREQSVVSPEDPIPGESPQPEAHPPVSHLATSAVANPSAQALPASIPSASNASYAIPAPSPNQQSAPVEPVVQPSAPAPVSAWGSVPRLPVTHIPPVFPVVPSNPIEPAPIVLPVQVAQNEHVSAPVFPPVVEPKPVAEVTPKPVDVDSDDGDLYSMRNFSV